MICVTVPLIGAPAPRTMSGPRATVQVPPTSSKAKPLRLPDTVPSGTAINAAFQSTTFCQNGTRKLCS
jgi:hypothetical protein